ncbi:MAG: hypothetical protein Kapaf2KO_04780 [Candidatus Kapaibacteriales bacterium]
MITQKYEFNIEQNKKRVWESITDLKLINSYLKSNYKNTKIIGIPIKGNPLKLDINGNHNYNILILDKIFETEFSVRINKVSDNSDIDIKLQDDSIILQVYINDNGIDLTTISVHIESKEKNDLLNHIENYLSEIKKA